jgi:hypothetical protein
VKVYEIGQTFAVFFVGERLNTELTDTLDVSNLASFVPEVFQNITVDLLKRNSDIAYACCRITYRPHHRSMKVPYVYNESSLSLCDSSLSSASFRLSCVFVAAIVGVLLLCCNVVSMHQQACF